MTSEKTEELIKERIKERYKHLKKEGLLLAGQAQNQLSTGTQQPASKKRRLRVYYHNTRECSMQRRASRENFVEIG